MRGWFEIEYMNSLAPPKHERLVWNWIHELPCCWPVHQCNSPTNITRLYATILYFSRLQYVPREWLLITLSDDSHSWSSLQHIMHSFYNMFLNSSLLPMKQWRCLEISFAKIFANAVLDMLIPANGTRGAGWITYIIFIIIIRPMLIHRAIIIIFKYVSLQTEKNCIH